MVDDLAGQRTSSLRRSRTARQGLVAGAVIGSLGVAGALGLPATTVVSSPEPAASQADQGDGTAPWLFIQGDDDTDDGGRVWEPPPPSPQFGGGSVQSPHASSGGS